MRVGVILPSFEPSADAARSCAAEAEEAGIHGLFAYDHLWPPGAPGRSAIAPFPLLGMLAATTERVFLGTLVARIGVVPEDVLVAEFRTLNRLSGGRLIAGIGAGDHRARPRTSPTGWCPRARRSGGRRSAPWARRSSRSASRSGSGPARHGRMRSPGRSGQRSTSSGRGSAGSPSSVVRAPSPGAGSSRGARASAATQLRTLADAGATWAVIGWPDSAAPVVAAARAAGIPLGW